jgi:hypothetical protein
MEVTSFQQGGMLTDSNGPCEIVLVKRPDGQFVEYHASPNEKRDLWAQLRKEQQTGGQIVHLGLNKNFDHVPIEEVFARGNKVTSIPKKGR